MKIYGTVVLTGSPENLAKVEKLLGAGYVTESIRRNALALYDVTDADLQTAADCDTRVVKKMGAYEVKPIRKQASMLDLMQGGWYKTNQASFPVLRLRRVRHLIDTDDYAYDVDLFNEANLAAPATLSQEQMKSYSPKAASAADFESLDIAMPADFVPDPHAIPTPDTGMESGSEAAQDDDKDPIGVSLAQAHIAAALTKKELGVYCAATDVIPVGDGFGVEARLRARYARTFPERIGNTPVLYVYA